MSFFRLIAVGFFLVVMSGCEFRGPGGDLSDKSAHNINFMAQIIGSLAATFGGPIGAAAGSAVIAGAGMYTAGHRRGHRKGRECARQEYESAARDQTWQVVSAAVTATPPKNAVVGLAVTDSGAVIDPPKGQ